MLALLLWMAPAVRAEAEWVSPPLLDDVPVRAIDIAPEPIAPAPIVVPLPPSVQTGAAWLAVMAAARWWGSRRRG